MALVVRNTFLDFNQDEDSLQHVRSSSAPPTCRHKGESISEDCETFVDSSTEHSTAASDIDDFVSGSSNCDQDDSDHEHEDVSPPNEMTNDSDSDDENTQWQRPVPSAVVGTITEAAAQEQLDQMSQMVMDIWSKLRSVEAEVKNSKPAVVEAAPSVASAPAQGQTATSRLSGIATPFTPSGCDKTTEVQGVLASVRDAVLSEQGVTSAVVNLGPAGTLATICIQLQTSASPMLAKNLMNRAKSALLDAASHSETTYVLGYEATPFQDDRSGSSFVTALASLPKAWECSACWDTYTQGSCPRRRMCKWQHPGRNELQPVRVIVC